MKIEINDLKKILLLWKTTEEVNLPIPLEIQQQLDNYRNKKYRIFIMKSGNEDLFEPTLALLSQNRMKMAMNEVQTKNKARKAV